MLEEKQLADRVSRKDGGQSTAQQTIHEDDALPICFDEDRHNLPIVGNEPIDDLWRIRERMKTISVALVICLNVGVDPPDIFKINPCARMECWVDPSLVSSQKAMEMIGASLQKQYERWQPKARYKQSLDPTSDDVKKLCISLRRNAKEERVLFHYNGHGVPLPTVNGEIWVFNRTYTQYIPLSIYDLQTWVGAPTIFVYDCSSAGMIVNLFNQFAEQHEREKEQQLANNPPVVPPPPTTNETAPKTGAATTTNTTTTGTTPAYNPASIKNCIQLAACSVNQILPMNPNLPADLFTCCLTTPIKLALKLFTLQKNSSMVPVSYSMIERMPGTLNDRRTMLGELNWMFTAITDTIAFNSLPRDLFKLLFRQDLLVASLFRNFLLADRIMRYYGCTPVSSPALPTCHRHPMWASWDLALDLAIQQLPAVLENEAAYTPSTFFEDQLSAFDIWLQHGCEERNPPEQLPIVLQVLLSQVHRLRALELLGRFLDLGKWAVNLALSVGIFPYVLKLLQASATELRPLLVFIWAKILAVDNTCQVDLVCDHGHKYFLSVLQDANLSQEDRTLAAFVLASIVNGFPLGQLYALQGSLVSISLVQLNDPSPKLRQWLAIGLGHLWKNFDRARWSGVRDLAHEKLYPLLSDPVPEVRASAVYALGTFISSVTRTKDRTEHANNIDRSIAMTLLSTVGNDMSPIVRMEMIAAFQWMIILFENQFVSAFLQEPSAVSGLPAAVTSSPQHHSSHNAYSNSTNSLERNINMKRVSSSSSIGAISCFPSASIIGFGSTYLKLWQGLISLARDPHPEVADMAQKEIDHVVNQAVNLISAKEATKENFGTVGSLSLPPSPNTRTSYMGDSPPAHQTHINLNTSLDSSNSPSSKMFSSTNGHPKPKAVTPAPSRSRKTSKAGTEDADKKPELIVPPPAHEPIVTTNFIAWSVAQFSASSPKHSFIHSSTNVEQTSERDEVDCAVEAMQQCSISNDNVSSQIVDPHDPMYLERIHRFARNDETRRAAREQQRRAVFNRLETQSWGRRTQFIPNLVKLHPYELQIAVAYKNKIMVSDWVSSTIQSYVPVAVNKTLGSHTIVGATMDADVVTLEFINSHDRTLMLAGYEDGSLRIWRAPPEGSSEPQLITAWQSIVDVSTQKYQHNVGLVMSWLQTSQTAIVAGESKYIRCWDAATERKLCDIPTGSDAAVSSLSASNKTQIIATGYRDGSVRLFDKRIPVTEARIRTYRETSGSIVTSCLREDGDHLVTGCTQRSIRLFDIRQNGSLSHWFTEGELMQMSVHPSADILACGNQVITVYGLDGRMLSTIRSHGFMSKMGNVSCLSFHPLKVSLAAGFMDSAVAVYVTDTKRHA